jgi:hypothetical protein
MVLDKDHLDSDEPPPFDLEIENELDLLIYPRETSGPSVHII